MTIAELPPASANSMPKRHTPRVTLADGQPLADNHRVRAVGTNLTGSHCSSDAQSRGAAGDQTSPTAIPSALPIAAARLGTYATENPHRYPVARGPILADPTLAMCVDILNDLEAIRVANQNRLRTLCTPAGQLDKDGEARGHGLTPEHPDVAQLAALVDTLAKAEHQAVLNLQRAMRKHQLGPWVKCTVGVGEKQAARLLGTIRDPFWNDLHDRPRTVSELWAYCGYHVIKTSGSQGTPDAHNRSAAGSNVHPDGHCPNDAQTPVAAGVAPKRQRGQQSNWNEDARKRTYLIAESCIKQSASPYRKVYDDTRTKYADAVHNSPCTRCGPKGKPATEGSPLTLGHQHARGLRAVAKEILKDLWHESKRIHEGPERGCPKVDGDS